MKETSQELDQEEGRIQLYLGGGYWVAPSITNGQLDLGWAGIRVVLLAQDYGLVGEGKLGGNPWNDPCSGGSY